jgi:hypothetical protein
VTVARLSIRIDLANRRAIGPGKISVSSQSAAQIEGSSVIDN